MLSNSIPLSIELYIDRGRDADSETEELFDTLKESKEDIEEASVNRSNGSDLKVNAPVELVNNFLWVATAMRRNGRDTGCYD